MEQLDDYTHTHIPYIRRMPDLYILSEYIQPARTLFVVY